MVRMRLAILILLTLSLAGCAKQYKIPRYDGSFFVVDSYKYGDINIYYKVEKYENGNIKSEAYGHERKISPVLSEVGNVAKSALAGAREGL